MPHLIIKTLARQESQIHLRLCPRMRVAGPKTAQNMNR